MFDSSSMEDLNLVAQVLAGDRSRYSVLVRKYQKNLLRLSLKFVRDLATAEDIVQEAFIKAFEKLSSFEGRSSFRGWLFQIASNTARNKLRERRDGMIDIETVQLSSSANAETALSQLSTVRLIQDFIQTLPERQKQAMELRVYEDFSFKEIAEIMDCPYDTAKANFRHALLKLKEHLQGSHKMSSWDSEDHPYQELITKPLEAEA
jgi:RNA polymerase sigma-70 factor, ECF subfamily